MGIACIACMTIKVSIDVGIAVRSGIEAKSASLHRRTAIRHKSLFQLAKKQCNQTPTLTSGPHTIKRLLCGDTQDLDHVDHTRVILPNVFVELLWRTGTRGSPLREQTLHRRKIESRHAHLAQRRHLGHDGRTTLAAHGQRHKLVSLDHRRGCGDRCKYKVDIATDQARQGLIHAFEWNMHNLDAGGKIKLLGNGVRGHTDASGAIVHLAGSRFSIFDQFTHRLNPQCGRHHKHLRNTHHHRHAGEILRHAIRQFFVIGALECVRRQTHHVERVAIGRRTHQ